jgi:hypothetical protein
MSPAAFTITPVMHGSAKAASACWAAHPFTRPVGSIPPGIAHGSNQPPDSSRAAAQRHSTSATSAGASDTVIFPARSRLISLSGCQVLNTSSARCRTALAQTSCSRTSANSAAVAYREAYTSMVTIVPITFSR